MMLSVWPGPHASLTSKVAILCHFDPVGDIRLDLLHYLAELGSCGFSVVLVSNGRLREPAVSRLRERCAAVLERTNSGYDFAAWHEAMAVLCLPRSETECLLLANDSVYGPFAPLRDTLARIDFNGADVWGLTESLEIRHHLQSYFLAFGSVAMRSQAWWDYWRRLRPARSRRGAIRNGEIGLASSLDSAGLRMAALFPFTPASVVNPCILRWRELLAAGHPFLKRQLLRDNPYGDPFVATWREQVEACSGEASEFLLSYVAKDLHLQRMRPGAPPRRGLGQSPMLPS